jgi:hypothetical protein
VLASVTVLVLCLYRRLSLGLASLVGVLESRKKIKGGHVFERIPSESDNILLRSRSLLGIIRLFC